MQKVLNQTIVRTERGLVIAGTGITIYQLMDSLKADRPTSLVKDLFRLTDEQMDGVLRYIAEHRTEAISKQPPSPGKEALHANSRNVSQN